jgi:hypothetical protein
VSQTLGLIEKKAAAHDVYLRAGRYDAVDGDDLLYRIVAIIRDKDIPGTVHRYSKGRSKPPLPTITPRRRRIAPAPIGRQQPEAYSEDRKEAGKRDGSNPKRGISHVMISKAKTVATKACFQPLLRANLAANLLCPSESQVS